MDYEKDKWTIYGNVEAKFIASGDTPEIKNNFAGNDLEFRTRGAKEGRIEGGIGLGAQYKIAKHWKAFANAKTLTAKDYLNVFGNIGIRYLFGSRDANKRAANAAAKAETEQIIVEESVRLAEEAKIEEEISDEELEKEIEEAQERRNREMLKTFDLTFNFATDVYFLSPADKARIKEIADEIKTVDYNKITIEGHTDSTGTNEHNKKLSRQRARSVYDELIKDGLYKDKTTYQGFAATMPIDTNATASGRAKNRRTQVFVE